MLENPLVEGLERLPVHPTSLVIFGATGDLSQRKLLPAIYNLAHDGALPERFFLVGVARSEMSDEQFRELAARAVREFSRRPPDEEVLRRLLENASYLSGSVRPGAGVRALKGALADFEDEAGRPLNRVLLSRDRARFFPMSSASSVTTAFIATMTPRCAS